MATHYDAQEFRGTVRMKPVSIPFTTAQIKSGALAGDLPAGAVVIGESITMTQALAFSGTTTGITIKAGTAADDDGYFAATQVSGAAGNKPIAAAGALVGWPR
ncbi:hypothetical protein OV203_02395 [Nannocystis sp. ILAH1]|uniref:hypothetical protein n=1 Tax=Nannocystis sp. ILAH1 TaxID=2996789 RepID=UPI00227172C3|nr:hypothetical protein [Nannocystis sp. ILAH1]MCY0985961.1 hypothetical protein [Nannocystis sp. ILAH1]